MRDKTHTEHIERWAEFVKMHPRSVGIDKIRRLREKSGFNLKDSFFRI
jgi:hypothetical protein